VPARTVIKFPDERLKEKSSLVEDFSSEETTNIIKDLKDTLNVQQGLAIAAPQVGFAKQIVVLDLEKLANKKYEESEKYFVLINPTIKEQSNQTSISKEGCLSIPGIIARVKRNNTVKVNYINESGEDTTAEFGGFSSFTIQHEIDHLNGQTMLDRVSYHEKKKHVNKYMKNLKKVKRLLQSFRYD